MQLLHQISLLEFNNLSVFSVYMYMLVVSMLIKLKEQAEDYNSRIAFDLLILYLFTYSNTFLAHLSRRLIGELIVYKGIRRPFVNIFKGHLL